MILELRVAFLPGRLGCQQHHHRPQQQQLLLQVPQTSSHRARTSTDGTSAHHHPRVNTRLGNFHCIDNTRL